MCFHHDTAIASGCEQLFRLLRRMDPGVGQVNDKYYYDSSNNNNLDADTLAGREIGA